MTGFLQGVRCKAGGRVRAPRPTEQFVGADDSVRPASITQRLVGQAPCALPGAEKIRVGPSRTPAPTKAQQEVQWAGDRKGRPYESVTTGAGKESPSHGFAVPAPFRQGGHGRGVRIATPVNRSLVRNDRVFARECGARLGGGVRAPRPTERFVGADDSVRPR